MNQLCLKYLTIRFCFIANAKNKRDWLIRSHVTLHKCDVPLGKQVKPATNIKNKMAA